LHDEKSDAIRQVTKVRPAGPGTKRVAQLGEGQLELQVQEVELEAENQLEMKKKCAY
jgi:hypothetical protein